MERICLIVDDEPIIRTYLKTILQSAGSQGLEAENAPQAFRMLQKLNGGVNLVLSDIQMPGEMNGVDLAHAIRDAFPGVPVILISGYAESAKYRGGRFDPIQKPFAPPTILAAVRKPTDSCESRPASS